MIKPEEKLNNYIENTVMAKNIGFHTFQEAFSMIAGYTHALTDYNIMTDAERAECLIKLSKRLGA